MDTERRFTCGVTTAGDALCWGLNHFGQLGRGTVTGLTPKPTPAVVVGGHTFQSVTALAASACGLTPAGVALCWGRNGIGELGIGMSGASRPTPQFVTGGHTFTYLNGGFLFACGVRTDGAGLCWGQNSAGQVGNGTFLNPITVPALVLGGHTFQTIEGGWTHACGVTTASDLFCWGNNFSGQLGDGTFSTKATPQFVIDLSP